MSNKPQLSRFFQENQLKSTETVFCLSKNREMTLQEYSDSKGVGDMHSIDDNRSICQMLRNTNGLTKHQYHVDFIFLINLANNAVKVLGDYSKAADGRWGDPDKRRSNFTEEKRQIGLQYLADPHHSVFAALQIIKDKTKEERAKDYITEVSYYFEKVNNKLLEYELASK